MRMLCAKAGLAVAASTAAAQVGLIPAEVLIRSGDTVQDGNGTTHPITTVSSPVTNASGNVLFVIETPGGTGTVRGLVTNRSGFIQLVALQGQPIAPASSDPARLWGSLATVGLSIADNGRLIVGAQASPAFDLGSYSRWGLMTSDAADQWTLTAATGLPLPGDPTRTYTGPILLAAAQVDTGRVGFAVRVGTEYLFLRESDTGLAVVDALPPIPLLMSPGTPSLTSSGSYAYTGQQNGQPYGFIRGQFAGDSAMVSVLEPATTFLNAPGSWRVGPDADILSGNAAGELLFSTWLVDSLNESAPPLYALVKSTADGLVLLAKSGDPIPGHPGLVWQNFGRQQRRTLGFGRSGVAVERRWGGGDFVQQVGDRAFQRGPIADGDDGRPPGRTVTDLPGYTYSQTFVGAMTRSGRMFYSNSVVAQDHSAYTAIFAADAAGASRAVIVEGASVVNIPGLGGRVVYATSGVVLTGGNDGLKRTVTEDGRIAVRLLHATGSAIALLSAPCAADIGTPGGLPVMTATSTTTTLSRSSICSSRPISELTAASSADCRDQTDSLTTTTSSCLSVSSLPVAEQSG